jgi:hypothetical protein
MNIESQIEELADTIDNHLGVAPDKKQPAVLRLQSQLCGLLSEVIRLKKEKDGERIEWLNGSRIHIGRRAHWAITSNREDGRGNDEHIREAIDRQMKGAG